MAQDPGRLEMLSDTGKTVADPTEDVRGRKVFDADGEEIGTVDDLFVDETDQVRFLRVGAGGFLGIGEQHFLVPVEAITATEAERVRVDRGRTALREVPTYDPDLTDDVGSYYGDVYGWWGVTPYWGMGAYPGPAYPRGPQVQ
ncbi:PRC-barrel domain-containing protein [Georgenia subflava]|uniref:DUF2171 domain-containing protein n=1 Tax=Georgenia subflava TaxID=1622177 RepID=A0A6N7ES06_9MICO|nr:PRC-barrel domain-containing protein [Georgenia subflava]MPV38896.1 DUF2171 domain-containing protein [Georgenia subflava]